MKAYVIQMEVDGGSGMFKREDTGSNPTTHILPTISAAKGMYEAVMFRSNVRVVPVRCGICFDPKMMGNSYSSNTWDRGQKALSQGLSNIIHETKVYKPCYRLEALVLPYGRTTDQRFEGLNQAHAYQEQFKRWLRNGKYMRTVHFGRSQMMADYWGPYREETMVNTKLNFTVENMLVSMFDLPVNGTAVCPTFKTVHVKDGVAEYFTRDEIRPLLADGGGYVK